MAGLPPERSSTATEYFVWQARHGTIPPSLLYWIVAHHFHLQSYPSVFDTQGWSLGRPACLPAYDPPCLRSLRHPHVRHPATMAICIQSTTSALTLTAGDYTLVFYNPASAEAPIETAFLPSSAATVLLAGQVKWWADPVEVLACLGLVRVGGRIGVVAVTEAITVLGSTKLASGVGESVMAIRSVRFFALGDDLPIDAAHPLHPCYDLNNLLTDGNTYFIPSDSGLTLLDPLLARLPPSPSCPSPPATARPLTPSLAGAPLSQPAPASPVAANIAWLAPVTQFCSTLSLLEQTAFIQLRLFVPCVRGYVGSRLVGLGGQDTRLTVVGRVALGADGQADETVHDKRSVEVSSAIPFHI